MVRISKGIFSYLKTKWKLLVLEASLLRAKYIYLPQLQAQQLEVAGKKAEIDELLNNIQKLLEQRPEGDKSELEQQQYQQLRITSSDLKVTYEKVK